jgi:acetyl-CoA C-acetyltransferase
VLSVAHASVGSATLIVVSEEALKKFNLKPLARIVGWGVAGVDPKVAHIIALTMWN